MILTVTPNPALDVTYTLDAFVPGESHAVSDIRERAGGKGVNVAAVLARFGYAVGATGPLGGPLAGAFAAAVSARGVTADFVASPVPVRRSTTVVTGQQATVLNEVGAEQPEQVWDALEARVHQLAPGDVLTVSGSMPPAAPLDLVARLVRDARDCGAWTVLDVRGAALRVALEEHPSLVTPNAAEAQETTGCADPVQAAAALAAAGAGAALVTCGAAGVILHLPRRPVLRAKVPVPISGNPTGAGDALTAALASRLDGAPDLPTDERWWAATLRWAVAWSAAAVLQPVAGIVDPADAQRLLSTVVLEEIR